MNAGNELMKMVRDVSPVIWEATVRQKYIEGMAFLGFGMLCGLVALIAWGIREKEVDGRYEVLSGFSALFFCALIILGIMRLVNPEYWAIMDLKP